MEQQLYTSEEVIKSLQNDLQTLRKNELEKIKAVNEVINKSREIITACATLAQIARRDRTLENMLTQLSSIEIVLKGHAAILLETKLSLLDLSQLSDVAYLKDFPSSD